jgi:hypothetical protein
MVAVGRTGGRYNNSSLGFDSDSEEDLIESSDEESRGVSPGTRPDGLEGTVATVSEFFSSVRVPMRALSSSDSFEDGWNASLATNRGGGRSSPALHSFPALLPSSLPGFFARADGTSSGAGCSTSSWSSW